MRGESEGGLLVSTSHLYRQRFRESNLRMRRVRMLEVTDSSWNYSIVENDNSSVVEVQRLIRFDHSMQMRHSIASLMRIARSMWAIVAWANFRCSSPFVLMEVLSSNLDLFRSELVFEQQMVGVAERRCLSS